MTRYLLDTDALSLYECGHPVLTARVEATPPDELFISVLSIREQLEGWLGLIKRVRTAEEEARVYARLEQTVRFVAAIRVLPYTAAAIARFHDLKSARLNVGSMDLRIAAVALEHEAVVVTRNLRDFGRVPGLTAEDWST